MDHRKLVQQRLGEPGRGARGGRRQEREQRGAGGGEGGGLREPCLKIPFHRQDFISWGGDELVSDHVDQSVAEGLPVDISPSFREAGEYFGDLRDKVGNLSYKARDELQNEFSARCDE